MTNSDALIPSQFFNTVYQFSDNSKSIYEAAQHYVDFCHTETHHTSQTTAHEETQSVEKNTDALAKGLFELCKHNVNTCETLLVLAIREAPELSSLTDSIIRKVLILNEKEPHPQELPSPGAARPSPHEHLIHEPALSPLPKELKIDPTLEKPVREYLINGDEASLEVVAKLFENYSASEILKTIKFVEHTLIEQKQSHDMKGSSYELRTQCCIRSRGAITTVEAYTYALDPALFNDKNLLEQYAKTEAHYIPERQREHYRVIVKSTVEMMNMSRRFHDAEPTIYAVRGGTASGKTNACKNDEQFKKGLLCNQPVGALNPDTVKMELRGHGSGITSQQTHLEGAALNEKLTKELKKKAVNSSLVIDERLAEKGKIIDIIEATKSKNSVLKLFDVEVPLVLSCCRVLRRNIDNDPCVPFNPIIKGYIAVKNDRAEVIEEVKTNPAITSYKLVVTTPDGKKEVAAIKNEKGEFQILDQALYEYAITKPDIDEVNALGNRIIDDDLIQSMKKNYPNESWEHLEEYKGETLKAALDIKSTQPPNLLVNPAKDPNSFTSKFRQYANTHWHPAQLNILAQKIIGVSAHFKETTDKMSEKAFSALQKMESAKDVKELHQIAAEALADIKSSEQNVPPDNRQEWVEAYAFIENRLMFEVGSKTVDILFADNPSFRDILQRFYRDESHPMDLQKYLRHPEKSIIIGTVLNNALHLQKQCSGAITSLIINNDITQYNKFLSDFDKAIAQQQQPQESQITNLLLLPNLDTQLDSIRSDQENYYQSAGVTSEDISRYLSFSTPNSEGGIFLYEPEDEPEFMKGCNFYKTDKYVFHRVPDANNQVVRISSAGYKDLERFQRKEATDLIEIMGRLTNLFQAKGHVITGRTKSTRSIFDKCGRISQMTQKADTPKYRSTMDIIDVNACRITCSDPTEISDILSDLKANSFEFLELDNKYASIRKNAYKFVVCTLRDSRTGVVFELQITSLSSTCVSDLHHNIIYKKEALKLGANAQQLETVLATQRLVSLCETVSLSGLQSKPLTEPWDESTLHQENNSLNEALVLVKPGKSSTDQE